MLSDQVDEIDHIVQIDGDLLCVPAIVVKIAMQFIGAAGPLMDFHSAGFTRQLRYDFTLKFPVFPLAPSPNARDKLGRVRRRTPPLFRRLQQMPVGEVSATAAHKLRTDYPMLSSKLRHFNRPART